MISTFSLRSKLLTPIILFSVVIFFVSQLYSFVSSHAEQKDVLVERTKVLANGVAYNLQAAILFNDSLGAKEVLSAFSADEQILRVKLYTADGQLFSMYERRDASAPIPNATQRAEIVKQGYSMGDKHLFLLVPILVEGEAIAKLRVVVSKSSFSKIYDRTVNNAMLFLGLLVISSATLYLMAQKFILDPVYALNQAIQSFNERKTQSTRLSASSSDEIGDLVNAFNHMLDKIGQRDQQVAYTLDKLEQEKFFVNEVVEAVRHALVVVDSSGNILHSNAASNEVFKCTPAYLKGANFLEILNTDKYHLLLDAVKTGKEFDDELLVFTNVFSDKQLLKVSCRKLSRQDQFLFAIRDVTVVEAALKRQKLAAGVFENSQDGLVVLNQDGVITMTNPAVAKLLGYSQEQLMNKRPSDVLEWRQFGTLMPTIIESVDNFGQWQGEIWEKHSSGQAIPMFVKVNRIATEEGDSVYDYVLILSDLSNMKEMERLEYLAHHDLLTGLANRAQLNRVMDEILSPQYCIEEGVGLLYLDLDGFKQVNDTYGHDAGDEVLKQVAERLLSQVQSQDLVARLSGDEFVLVLRSCDVDSLEDCAVRLLSLMEKEIIYKGRVLRVGASIGGYHITGGSESQDAIMKAADTAMYQAKSSGKGRYVVHSKVRTG
ncbi:sensor domain-containing diguanylate cyclase [Vibrio paucivorans]|uniref:Diguanylate cyclase n=1 Tax=Vibrio paucivorans TaxID=2829489 RepID=A0A9X3CFN3_9VIBR|nr:diguanylate cyclase [Vibrio paucivorans]MCW8334938.1 diguanylate cyclase [Vibrio paucivorans]